MRREGDVAERLDAVGAEVHRRLGQRAGHAAQPGDDVVVDDDHAERRVADHDRPEPEVDLPEREVRVERHAGDDPGQRDRQHEQERDRLRGRRSGNGARRTTPPSRAPARSAWRARRPSARARAPAACRRCGSPARTTSSSSPGSASSGRSTVERVEADQHDRDVEEREHQRHPGAERDAGRPRLSIRAPRTRRAGARSEVDAHHDDRHDRERRRERQIARRR